MKHLQAILRTACVAAAVAAVAAVAACGGGGDDDDVVACDPATASCLFENDFGVKAIAPGEEVLNFCQSWTLHNPTELWVTRVEMTNSGGYHHSNWFFVPDNTFDDVPDGGWDCEAGGFDELTAAILGGVLYAQYTQSTVDVQQFPSGAAVRIPPYSRVIGSTHLLNTGDLDLMSALGMKVTTTPEAQVTVKLAPFRLTYHDLHIPGMGQQSEFTGSCDIKTAHEDLMNEPFALKLYWALPHYHQHANHFELKIFGGPSDGTLLFENNGYGADTYGKPFDPPIDLGDAMGFTFGCRFGNEGTTEIGWGNGDGEMCVMLGFAETTMAFDAEVRDGAGMVIGTTPDGVIQATGDCSVLGIPYFQDKEGGTGP